MKKFTINIPKELHMRLKIACALEGKDMTTVVLKMVEEYVEKVEKRKLIVLSRKR
jgi:predicted DNA-binding protein